jgi:hypothetical protein
MSVINAQPNNAIYPSTVGDRGLSNGVPSSAVNLTPTEADRFTKQSKQENSLELESPSQSKVSPWVWAVGGLATLGVIGLVGWAWWKNKNPESAAKGATGAVNQFVTPHKDPNFTGLQPKRSYNQVQALCEQVMIPDNGGLACQTMSFFNSLRLYKTFAEKEGTFANDASQQRINDVLSSATSPDELKVKAFDLCRKLFPQEYNTYLANNTISMEKPKPFLTTLIPHFLSQYVFNKTEQSINTNINGTQGINHQDIAHALESLCNGNVGMFYGTPWRGSHVISLVGIHEAEQGAINQVIEQLRRNEMPADKALLEKINLLIYDQNRSSASVEGISLKTVLEENAQDKFRLRVFNSHFNNNKVQELAFNHHSTFPYDIVSDQFHTRLIRTGNAVFNAT